MAEEKIKFGTQLRAPIKKHLDEIVEELGGGQGLKQEVVEAALLLFYEAKLDHKLIYIRRIRDADLGGGTSELVKEAKVKAKAAKRTRYVRPKNSGEDTD